MTRIMHWSPKKLIAVSSGIILLSAIFIPVLTRLAIAEGEKQTKPIGKREVMKYNDLTPEEKRVIINKGTEAPFSGIYNKNKEEGNYLCKHCDALLFRSSDKFESECGWPSFDDAVKGAVKEVLDVDGRRTEILCTKCGGHLGHVFKGEGITDKNVRHCVNSISLRFEPITNNQIQAKAYFAGGCFWGVEYYLQKVEGVKSVVSGYMGGHTENPTYDDVCSGITGHAETVEITYDPNKTDYEELARIFFEIHDPTQGGRQGPDIGDQYRSVVFYSNDDEKNIIDKLIGILKGKGFKIVTELKPAEKFWSAEIYHQDYYDQNGKTPYCHSYTKRF